MPDKKPRHTRPTAVEFEQMIRTKSPAEGSTFAPETIIQTCAIKVGPRSFKGARVDHIASHETGEIVKERLSLYCWQFGVTMGIDFSAPQMKWVCEDGEIEQLRTFLNTFRSARENGHHAVVRVDPQRHEPFRRLIDAVNDPHLDVGQLAGLITALAARAGELRQVPRLGADDDRRMVAAALRAAHRAEALRELRELIQQDALEQKFQSLLKRNWWMLGGRYVRLIALRNLTEQEIVDLLLQTADRYFEVVELKRAGVQLFVEDHNTLIPSAEVHRAVNQAATYIGEIEARRDYYARRYGFDPFKLRAKIVIGHVSKQQPQEPTRREALRRYNAHLHSIEVITYDELERIAEQVIEGDRAESQSPATAASPDQAQGT
jgi:hypothetical protein